MLLSAVFVLVAAQSSSEIPEGLMNNPVHANVFLCSRVGVATTGSDRIEIDLPRKGSEPRSKLSPKFGVLEQWRGDGWPSSNDRIRI